MYMQCILCIALRVALCIFTEWEFEELHTWENLSRNIPTETDAQKGPLSLERLTGRALTGDGRTSPSMDVGDTFRPSLYNRHWQLTDVLSNYINEASTEEGTIEDCAVGEWIFQGNTPGDCPPWTLDMFMVITQPSAPVASISRLQDEELVLKKKLVSKKYHFTYFMSHNATNFDIPVTSFSPKVLFVNLSLLQVGGWTMLVVVQGDPLLLSTTVVGLDILAPRHPKLHALLINRLGFQLSQDSRGEQC